MHKSTHRKKNGALPIKPLLLAVLLSVGAATVLMLLFSLFLYLEWLPEDAIPEVLWQSFVQSLQRLISPRS